MSGQVGVAAAIANASFNATAGFARRIQMRDGKIVSDEAQ
jgi:hypothetical protein